MQSSFISTRAVTSALRQSIVNMQSDLATAQKEVSTGRLADVGLSLGASSGQTVSLRSEQANLQTITDTNGVVGTRLSTTAGALTDIQQTAQDFLDTLVSDGSNTNDPSVVQAQATNGLQSLIGSLNTTLGGQYIFAGVNTDVKPVGDYTASPASPSKQAVDAAFQATFGMSQTDPNVSTISASAMQNFLDNQFAALFQGTNWTSDWSSASSQPIRSRIAPSELADTSVSANQPAMQKLAMAFTMISDLGITSMSAATQQVMITAATNAAGTSVQQLTTLQASVGATQQRVTNANAQMSVQMNILQTQDDNLEQVDPYEASTRVNNLTTQIETAYSLTAQLQQLSLAKYLLSS